MEDLHWATPGLWGEFGGTLEPLHYSPLPPKKMFLSGNVDFRGLRLSLGHFVNKSLKALCLSSKMVYQHLLYTLSLWTC